MKRLIQVVAAVIIILVLGNTLTRGKSSGDLAADVQRAAGIPHRQRVSTEVYARESSASQARDPNSPEEPETSESRFDRAKMRYRNVAQQLLDSLADWEQRVQETIRRLERFEVESESAAILRKNKEIGKPDFSNRIRQEAGAINDQSLPALTTSAIEGPSQSGTPKVGSDKTSNVSDDTMDSPGLGLKESERTRQTKDLARRCEQLAEQLNKLAGDLREYNKNSK